MPRSSNDETRRAPGGGSLAGRLGRIPRSPRPVKPRPPKVERAQTSVPPKGHAKPRPAKPNKPVRPEVPQRTSAARSGPPPLPPPGRSVASQLGSVARGAKRPR